MRWLALIILMSCQLNESESHIAGSGGSGQKATADQETTVKISSNTKDKAPPVEPQPSEPVEAVMRWKGMDIAKIRFTPLNNEVSSGGIPKLRVDLFSLKPSNNWDGLQEGAKLHLTFPVSYAFEDFAEEDDVTSDASKFVKHRRVKFPSGHWVSPDLFTNKDKGMSRNWFDRHQTHEFELDFVDANQSFGMIFQLKDIPQREHKNIIMRASMDIQEDKDKGGFMPFNSAEHSLWFNSKCSTRRQMELLTFYSRPWRTQFFNSSIEGTIIKAGQFVGVRSRYAGNQQPTENTSTLRVNSWGKITVTNRQLIDLFSGDGSNIDNQHWLVVRVSTTARSGDIKVFGKNHERVHLTDSYAYYHIKSSPTIPIGSLELEIPVTPAREGEIEVSLSKAKGRNLGFGKTIPAVDALGVPIPFHVAPEESCIYAD